MKKLMLAAIRFYRKRISPSRPPCCRFIPTCSQYAMEAIEKYGALKGGVLALRAYLLLPSVLSRAARHLRSRTIAHLKKQQGESHGRIYLQDLCLAAGQIL